MTTFCISKQFKRQVEESVCNTSKHSYPEKTEASSKLIRKGKYTFGKMGKKKSTTQKIKQNEELTYQKRNSDSLVRQIPTQQFDKINSSAKLC